MPCTTVTARVSKAITLSPLLWLAGSPQGIWSFSLASTRTRTPWMTRKSTVSRVSQHLLFHQPANQHRGKQCTYSAQSSIGTSTRRIRKCPKNWLKPLHLQVISTPRFAISRTWPWSTGRYPQYKFNSWKSVILITKSPICATKLFHLARIQDRQSTL